MRVMVLTITVNVLFLQLAIRLLILASLFLVLITRMFFRCVLCLIPYTLNSSECQSKLKSRHSYKLLPDKELI